MERDFPESYTHRKSGGFGSNLYPPTPVARRLRMP